MAEAKSESLTGIVRVDLKPMVNDPAGLSIKGGLHHLGFSEVTQVRAGKILAVTLEGLNPKQAYDKLDEMAKKLLANPVIEEYTITVPGLEVLEEDATKPVALRPSTGPIHEI